MSECSSQIFDPTELLSRFTAVLEGKSELPEGFACLLASCFVASLFSEEGVPVRFRATVADGPLQKHVLQLRSRVPIGPETLRKHCLTIDPDRSCLVVSRQADGKWAIVGISGRWRIFQGLLERQNSFEIAVRGPGQISLAFGVQAIAYDRGVYRTPRGEFEVLEHLPEGSNDALVRFLTEPGFDTFLSLNYRAGIKADEEQWKQNQGEFKGEVKEQARIVLAEAICKLIEATKRLGRGGGLLFLATDSVYPAPPATPAGTFFEIEDLAGPWNAGMTEWLAWDAHRGLAEKGKYIGAGLEEQFRTNLQLWIDRVVDGRCDFAALQWLEDIERCARLTQVDGAVVFGPLLAPIAYGQTFELSARNAGSGGHRHKSMRAEVERHPGALGVVVSHDGHVTLFKRTTDGLYEERMDL